MSFLNKILSEKKEKKSPGKKEAQPEKEAEKAIEDRVAFVGGVVLGSHITEKTAGQNQGTYVFKVSKNANKIEVKRAIEKRFQVKVEKVNIVNLPGKERRRGRQIGWKAGLKKAMVTLKEGETLEVE